MCMLQFSASVDIIESEAKKNQREIVGEDDDELVMSFLEF